MKYGNRAIESSLGMMTNNGYDSKLNRVHTPCVNNQSNLRRPDTIGVEGLVYPVRISYKNVHKYTSFVNSRFNGVFSDFLFSESICIAMKEKTSREYLKLLQTSKFLNATSD